MNASDVALQLARARRLRGGGAPLRRAFVLLPGPGAKGPLQSLLSSKSSGGGGGRGGGTRLALLLSILWVSSEGDHSSQRPARFWAQLLGLGDAEQGVRVVGANLRELERRGFIRLERAGENEPPIVRLLNETLTREPYTVPALDGDSYFRIPETLWTSGALAKLDGPSLAIYLILLYYYRPGRPGVWFSPPAFHAKHGLSETTRLKGIAGLEKQGIITTSWEPVDRVGGTLNRTYKRRRLELTPQYAPPASFGRPVERSTGT